MEGFQDALYTDSQKAQLELCARSSPEAKAAAVRSRRLWYPSETPRVIRLAGRLLDTLFCSVTTLRQKPQLIHFRNVLNKFVMKSNKLNRTNRFLEPVP